MSAALLALKVIESINYGHENGIDSKEIREWK
jgi:hypothetical protein